MILHPASPLYTALLELGQHARMVFFAGLPGTGKSLLIHQLVHLASARGRSIHLLQWDVARPVFEAGEAGQRYPLRDGVTHSVIRMAAGLWAREALTQWDQAHPDTASLLVGETPFVGHRFIELARPGTDAAEAVLGRASTRFIIPVPTLEVRRHLEAERERRAARPLHQREREDAPPAVLRALWKDLVAAGHHLGVIGHRGVIDGASRPDTDYDPVIYRRVYERILSRRHCQVLMPDDILPTDAISPYDMTVPYDDLIPTAEEVRRYIAMVEETYPDQAMLQREIDRWYASP